MTHTPKTHSHPYLTCERAWGSSLLCLDGWWPEDIMNWQTADRMKRRKRERRRGDGRITMLRLEVILLSLHHYTELQLVSVSHCAWRCWVIWAGSFIKATCKRLSALFTLTCLIFCASQSYCEKQRNMQKREMFRSITSSLWFCCVTEVTKKTEVLYTTHVNLKFDWLMFVPLLT